MKNYLRKTAAAATVAASAMLWSSGAMAAMQRPEPVPLPELLAGARRVAVLEDIVDHTNVGAIFRSAAALGVDAVWVNAADLVPTAHIAGAGPLPDAPLLLLQAPAQSGFERWVDVLADVATIVGAHELAEAAGHPEEVRATVGTYTKIGEDARAKMVLPKFVPEFNREAATKLGEAAVSYGTLKKAPNLDELLPTG